MRGGLGLKVTSCKTRPFLKLELFCRAEIAELKLFEANAMPTPNISISTIYFSASTGRICLIRLFLGPTRPRNRNLD